MLARALIALAVVLGILLAPGTAQARTPCPGEVAPATAENAPQIADAIACLVAEQRTRFGLAPFARDARLDQAAAGHSQDMASRGYFAHESPEGSTPSDRAQAAGYPEGAGENIAMGYPHARSVMAGWMGSTGHCKNLLSGAQDLGVGVAVASDGAPYYTQNFGRYGEEPSPAAGCPYVVDPDEDGVGDERDNCLDAPNADQADGDGDGTGNACDPDADGDGRDDAQDNCPGVRNPAQGDGDGDGAGDLCDPDRDGDARDDAQDNCPGERNPGQEDADGDGTGDVCDATPGFRRPPPGPSPTPTPAPTSTPSPVATPLPRPAFGFTLRRAGRRYTLRGTISPRVARLELKVRINGRTRRVVARRGRFVVRLRARPSNRVKVTITSAALPGRLAAGRQTDRVRLR